jgi:hypothetical protein
VGGKTRISLHPLQSEEALADLFQVKPETKGNEIPEDQSLTEAVNKWKAEVQQACEEWLKAQHIAIASHGEEGDSKLAAEKWERFMRLTQGEGLELPEGYVEFDPWR